MRADQLRRLDGELTEYLDYLTDGVGLPCRRSMGWYVTGLLLDGERKSMQPMAGRLVDDPTEIEAMRQRLQECVVISNWSEQNVMGRLAGKIDHDLPAIEAFVVDDTGFPKKGSHSVGVSRQYSGTMGRVDNCQVAVSLHLAGEQGSACIGMRLFLPEVWCNDEPRRRKAGIPDDVAFATKWQLAVRLLDQALLAGVRRHVVLGDAGYGNSTEFRQCLTDRGLPYVLRVQGQHNVFPPGTDLRPPRRARRGGRPRTYWRASDDPIAIADLARTIGRERYRRVSWRDGSRGRQSSHFAAMRVVSAEGYRRGAARPPGAELWLLCEWPASDEAPSRFWLSDLPAGTSIATLVRLGKLRWRIERDYQEMKEEVGLDHFEGRTWRGFHHHVALCALAHGFLALQRALFPPEEEAPDALAG